MRISEGLVTEKGFGGSLSKLEKEMVQYIDKSSNLIFFEYKKIHKIMASQKMYAVDNYKWVYSR